ncbi:MAG: hypothetical protein H0U05_00255 [Actinobacteria bacterium]|nr:hypothetical protein [Actinomycetota bacterium]
MEDALASPVVGVLIWLLGAAIPGVAGFWLGGRLVRRGGVVALLIGFSSVVTVVSFDPVTSAVHESQWLTAAAASSETSVSV